MINLLVILVIIGVLLYCVELLPMNATIKRIIQVVACLVAFLYVLQAFGIWHGMPLR